MTDKPTEPSPFLIDLHVHTRQHSPCSRIDPLDVTGRAQEMGLSAVVLTEHGYRWDEDELNELRAGAGDLLILSGAEITTQHGDLLIYGIEDADDIDAFDSAGKVIDAVREQDGFVVWAHPFRFGEPADKFARMFPPDAVEVDSSNMNADMTTQAHVLANRLGAMTIVASDAHRLEALGAYPFALPRPVVDERDLVACLCEMRR